VRHPMLLLVLSLAAIAATAGASQASPSARTSGVVLSTSGEKHLLRIVQGPRVVDASYRGALPTGVSAGAQISYVAAGQRASRIAVSGRVDHVVVSGTVVREGKQLALRLTDGSLLLLPRTRHPKVGSTTRATVRFTRSDGAGTPVAPGDGANPTTTPAGSCAKADCTFDVTGSVTAVDDDGVITLTPIGGGAALTVEPGQVDTGDVFVGDFLEVSGTQSAANGSYTLVSLSELPGCDTPDCSIAFDATVDDIESDSFSVADDDGDEYPFSATAAQLASIHVGDSVHVVATQDPTTGDYHVKTITVLASDPDPDPDPDPGP
jgi:hypothetical protein